MKTKKESLARWMWVLRMRGLKHKTIARQVGLSPGVAYARFLRYADAHKLPLNREALYNTKEATD